jgi:hypothetical protein
MDGSLMAVTPNYSWPVPVNTDYVKDGADAIKDLGDAIDATVFGLPAPASGLTLITTTTFSAVSTFSINSCFSATYNNYLIIGSTLASGLRDVEFRLRASGADSTTGYYGKDFQNYGGALVTKTNASAGFYQVANTTDQGLVAVTIQNPFVAVKTSYFSNAIAGGGATFFCDQNSNTHDVASAYDGFTILPTSGTMTGTLTVYGYQKS